MLIKVKVVGALKFLAKEISYNETIALQAVKLCRENYAVLPDELKTKKEFRDTYLDNSSINLFNYFRK